MTISIPPEMALDALEKIAADKAIVTAHELERCAEARGAAAHATTRGRPVEPPQQRS